MAKGPDAFRTISEAAAEVGVPAHVLRFWETRLSFIKPMKRAGGRRFYRPQDVAVLHDVRILLHDQGLGLKAVQSLHRAQGARGLTKTAQAHLLQTHVAAPSISLEHAVLSPLVRTRLRAVLDELEAARVRIERVLSAEP